MRDGVDAFRGTPLEDVFIGSGEVARLARTMDWESTPLGPVEHWPQSLKTAIRILLTTRSSTWLGWGSDVAFLYNDAYRRNTLGKKHPWAFGRPAREVWAEIWPEIEPRIRTVLETGTATWDEALLLILERNGYPEETYHTLSFSPLPDDDGRAAGIFCIAIAETQRVIGERRHTMLRELASGLASVGREDEVLAAIERGLGGNLRDLPFTLLYLFEDDGARARLAACTGIVAGHAAAPRIIDPAEEEAPWPTTELLRRFSPILVDDLALRFGELPTGAWDRAPKDAVVVPVTQQGQETAAGFLVVGLNPLRPYDDAYKEFIDRIAGQIAASLAKVRAYEEERRRAEALAELDRAKTVFFSNVSHEFRTPLSLMLGPLEELLKNTHGPLSREVRTELDRAHRNALRLLRLANMLLDFSRIEAGRIQARYEPTDLAAVTAELASTFRSAIERARMRLTVDVAPLPGPVYVDREMWEKIILNLLSNAFKFTLHGEIGVRVRSDGERVIVKVSDTGIGIPESELPHIFDRFHRVHGTKARTQEGSGIGLALVREMVRLHGGTISVESSPGRGSTFRVEIPLGTAHLPSDRIVSDEGRDTRAMGALLYVEEALRWLPDTPNAEPDGSNPYPLHLDNLPEPPHRSALRDALILVVDDNADMRDYLKRLLVRQGYRVQAVANGAAALDVARRQRPNLVLADVLMPALDGFGLLHALRTDPETREIPIVLLSARAGEEARIEGIEAGADDYVVKPFSARELIARIGAHLELARLRRQAAERERALREEAEQARATAEAASGQLRDIFMRAPAMIAMLRGPDHVVEFANARYLRLIGNRDILGKPVAEALPEAREQGFIESLDRVYRTGETYIADETLVRLERGPSQAPKEVYVNLAFQPLFEVDGSISGVLAHAVDITAQVRAREQIEQQALELEEAQAEAEMINEELHHANEELARRSREAELAREEAEEANKAKSRFLATMSHELRTPLNAIIGYSDLLDAGVAGPLNPEQRSQLERITIGAHHLLRMIDEILTFSRIEAGRDEVHVESVDLTGLVRETAELIAPLARSKALLFSYTVAEDLRATTDPGKLRQILLNLLSNAVKFTDSGSIGLEVICEMDTIVIRVTDTGIGIPPDERDRIFEPFRQIAQMPSRRAGGTGLGLSVTRHLACLLGGDIAVESTPGEGSTFTVRLLQHLQLQKSS